MVLLFLGVTLVLFDLDLNWFTGIGSAAFISIATIILLLLLIPQFFAPVAITLGKLLARTAPKREKKIIDGINKSFATFGHLAKGNIMTKLVAWTFAAWLAEGCVFWFAALALSSIENPTSGWLALPVGTLATLIPSAPGYFGTFDYFTIRAMTVLGNNLIASTAYAVLVHALLWLPPTLIGGIYLLLNPTIKNYNFPHRFKIQRHPVWGIAYTQYQVFSPVSEWDNQWLPLKPHGVVSSIASDELQVNFALSKYMLFDSEQSILEALDLKAVTNMRVGDVLRTASKKTIHKLSTAMEDVLPFIEQIERKAIAEQRIKSQIESEWESLPIEQAEKIAKRQSVEVSTADLKEIEDEVARASSKDSGYIVWLKRSLSDDPQYLSKTRPDVLPNPKLWNSIIQAGGNAGPRNAGIRVSQDPVTGAGSSVPAAEVLVAVDEHDDDAIVEGPESSKILPPLRSAGATAANDAAPSFNRVAATVPSLVAPSSRKLTTEENEAKTRRDYLKSAASRMASAANFMLDSVPTLYRKSLSSNILHASEEFSQTVLSSTEISFFEDHKDTDSIIQAIDARAARAEGEAWELLRLPIMERREIMLAGRAERERLASERAMIIADKRRHLSYVPGQEVIPRIGNENPEEGAEDINDLTVARLKIAAKNANLTGYSLLKKGDLLKRLKDYLGMHPELTINMLLVGQAGHRPPVVPIAAATITVPAATQQAVDRDVSVTPSESVTLPQIASLSGGVPQGPPTGPSSSTDLVCCVVECTDVASLVWEICHLKF
jgi:hypothetical protein